MVPDEVIRSELLDNEVLLWSGVPGQGIRLRRSDWFTIPFSILWAAFSVFWESSVLAQRNAPLMMKLWGIPFVLMGVYITVGRFVIDAWMRAATVYGVTDQRVLIVKSRFGRRVVSILRSRLPEINVAGHLDGSGTLTFGPESTRRGQPSSPAFEFIADHKSVLAHLMPQASRGYR